MLVDHKAALATFQRRFLKKTRGAVSHTQDSFRLWSFLTLC